METPGRDFYFLAIKDNEPQGVFDTFEDAKHYLDWVHLGRGEVQAITHQEYVERLEVIL